MLTGVAVEQMVLATHQVAVPAEPDALVWDRNPRVSGLGVPAQQEKGRQAAVGILRAGVVVQRAAVVAQVDQRD